jgi:D-aspartate ligase
VARGTIDTSVGVVWLKMAPGFYPNAGLGLIRSLGRLGVPVYAVHEEPRAPEIRSRYLTDTLIWDSANADREATLQAIRRLAEAIGGRPILVPSDDIGGMFLDEHADELKDCLRFPAMPGGLIRKLCSKREAHQIALELDVPVPETLFPSEREEIAAFAGKASYPVVVKSVEPWALHGRPHAPSVFIAPDAQALLDFCDAVHDPMSPNLILQEYIPGGAESVWMFNGYFDEHSECLFGLTGTKLRQFPPYTGVTTLGVCVANPTIEETTRRLMKGIGYRGILDIGYRYDQRDGRYKLLDVNPRIGGTFRLFVDDRGMDVARAMYLDLTGQEVLPALPRSGRKWLVENFDVVSSLRYARDRNLGPVSWIRSFRGVKECAWFARDDLRPFAAMVPRSIQISVTAAFRRRQMPGRLASGWPGRARIFRDRLTAMRRRIETLGPAKKSPAGNSQADVDAFFEAEAPFWRDLYRQETTYGTIHRHRHMLAISWLDRIGAPERGRALDVGCGAGHMAIALAKRGYEVSAIDRATAMVELTGRNAEHEEVADKVRPVTGDVMDLDFPDGAFSVVVALGVIPFLSAPARAVGEMARVLRPGGLLVVNVDNRSRLDRLIDPLVNPVLSPLIRALKRVLLAAGLKRGPDRPRATARTMSVAQFDRLLARNGIEKLEGAIFGFGPYTFLGRPVLSERTSLRLHTSMQRRADQGSPVIRSIGSQYMIVGRKRAVAVPGNSGPA